MWKSSANALASNLRDQAAIFSTADEEIPQCLFEAFAGRSHLIELCPVMQGGEDECINRCVTERVLFVINSSSPPRFIRLIEKALELAQGNVGVYIERRDAGKVCDLIALCRHNNAAIWNESTVGLLPSWLWYVD